MSYTSAAVLTLNGTDYAPISFDMGADNDWSPTHKQTVVLSLADMVAPVLTGRTNLITNTAASVDLTDAVGTSLTLSRQAPAQGIACAHSTAYRLTGTGSGFGQLAVGGGTGGMRLGMVAGKTYTASGTFYIDAAMTGSANTYARSIVVNVVVAGVASILTSSPAATNTAGTQSRVSVTFTVPAGATSVWIEWYHGHASTSVCYWTDLMLVEGNGLEGGAPIPFFDGDTASTVLYAFAWTAAAGKSSSTKSPAFVAPTSTPVVDPRATPYPTARLRYWFGDATSPDLIFDTTLLVRSYVIDDVEGTVTLTLESHEVLLQDYKNLDADYAPGAMVLGDMVRFALRKIGQTSTMDYGSLSATIPAAATVWRTGQSLDDWLQGAMRSAGFELFYDAFDTFSPQFDWWLMSNASKGKRIGAMGPAWGKNVLASRFGVNADDAGYADSAVLTYSWTDAAGASQRKSYAGKTGNQRKTLTKTFSTPDPGFNPATTAAVVAARSGLVQHLETLPSPRYPFTLPYTPAPIDLGVSVYYLRSDGTTTLGIANRYQISYPDDRMSLDLVLVRPNVGAGNVYPNPQP